MTHFLTLLGYDHPKLHSTVNISQRNFIDCCSFQNNDPGVLDQVKTEICRAVALYADNYSDEFKPYAPQFALTIWSLLTKLDLSPSYDEVMND